MDKVLVTGASGFIGLHCIAQLLQAGYQVRGSLRSRARESEIRNALSKVVNTENRLEICELDLLKDDGWDEAVSGCDYVMHVASPLLDREPKDQDEIIRPAHEGLMRAIKSSVRNKVKRFVMTSSFSAIGYGHVKDVFDESHWTDTTQKIGAYNKSKAIAEKAMWDYLDSLKDEEKIEAVAINPTLVIGASLSDDVGTSNIFLQKMLDGSYPVVPKVHFGYVTVKDTAKAHVAAMTHPHASGKRFILAERCMWLYEVNKILRKHGYKKAPIRQAPNLLMKFLALFNNEASAIAGFVGKTKFTNSENAKNILKFSFENVEVGILEIAQQLESLGVIKK
ncbi:MAG: SDR family oxidoreductase [Candidatus Pelagibacterales bacterium]|jgi:dihydroflavonol-4-reductase|nr:aldehyde reductase [Pelagibacteraceae bacterium]MDC3130631.1 aldehyde reductase [bacterium]|tara:strand:- start:1082 stop:2092 length:1011 start_codon:yes stop_codon:yes gene_type:complete